MIDTELHIQPDSITLSEIFIDGFMTENEGKNIYKRIIELIHGNSTMKIVMTSENKNDLKTELLKIVAGRPSVRQVI